MLLRHPLRSCLAALTTLATSSALLAVASPAAVAGPLGAGETIVSGTTTAGGVGEAGVAALPDGRFLTVWEGVRAVNSGTTQGFKREIFGRYVDAAGMPLGSPALVAQLGGADDATQDAADPQVTALSNGKVALVFAGDVLPDTGTEQPVVDRTSWQVFAAVIDPGQPLSRVTPTQVTSVLPTAAFDQQHPDLAEDHGQLRFVWQGDTPSTGDGGTAVWTAVRGLDLTGSAPAVQVAGPGSSRPRVAALADGGATADAVIAYETSSGGRRVGYRRIHGTALSAPVLTAPASTDEHLMPEVAASSTGYLLMHAQVAAAGRGLWGRHLPTTPGAADLPSSFQALTSGASDTWPSAAPDLAQPGDFVVSWARRTSTAGTGHYEIASGRLDAGAGSLVEVADISTVDGNMSADNAESLRPAVASQAGGTLLHAWGRVRNTGGPGVAIRRTAARVNLTAGVTVAPPRPTPARGGVNPADEVTVTYSYGNAAASVGSAPAHITTSFPGFTATGTTIAATSGPVPVATATPGVFAVGRLAPGQGGTITVSGTMDPAAEGAMRTAHVSVAPDGLVVEDPEPLNDAATASVVVDHPPMVTGITGLDRDPSNGAVRWRVVFDQAVTGVSTSEFALDSTGDVSSSVAGVSGSGTTWTVSSGPVTGNGTLRLSLAGAGSIVDGSVRPLVTGNLPFAGPAYTIDTTRPTVTTTPMGPDPSNAALLRFRLDFSEPVTAPDPTSLTVVNGTVDTVEPTESAAAPPTASWTVAVSPTADGPVSVTPQAGAAQDRATNPNEVGTTAARTSDRTRPVLALGGPAAPQRGAYDVTVTPSERVSGLTLSDFTVAGGAVESLTGSGPWTVRVQPTDEGDVTLTLPAGSVQDAATNTNPGRSVTTTYDATRPGATVTSAASARTSDDPVVFTLTFTEPVTGLDLAELDVAGGTASMTGSGATRTVSVVPDADGQVSVAVPADVAQDAAGNTNTAAPALTRTYDSTRPTPTISSAVSSPTNAATIQVRVAFDEDVVGFGPGDVVVSNGALDGWSLTDRVATFDVVPAGDGEVVVRLPAAGAQDLAGNGSLEATPLRVDVDRTRPSVTLTGPAADPTNAGSLRVAVLFSEAIGGLSMGDFAATNATVSDLIGSGSTWSVTLSPGAEGAFSLRLPAGAAVDAAGNTSTASATFERVRDTVAAADLAYTGPSTVGGPVTLALRLSDAAAIQPGDFEVVNGTVTVTGGPRDFDVVLTPTAGGDASVRLAAGAFTDAAGNTSAASQRVTVTHDVTRPGVVVSSDAGDPTSDNPILFILDFTEPVTGLTLSGLVVTGGTATLSGSGSRYTVAVVPTAPGPVSVAVLAGAAQDAVGNTSTAGAEVTRTYDDQAPAPAVTTTLVGPTNAARIPVTVTWSEAVTGFDASDVIVGNGTLSAWAGSGRTWTFEVTPQGDGEVVVRVPAGAAQDTSGNGSDAATPLRIVSDTTAPTVTLSAPVADPTNATSLTVTATFAEPVTGLDLPDFVVVNATALGLAGTGTTWTLTLAPGAEGTFGVSLPIGAARDAAGNASSASNLLERTSDRTARADLSYSGPTLVNGPFTARLVLSDPAVLRASDLSASGATVALDGGPTSYDVEVTPSGDGPVRVRLPAGAFTDAAGNVSTASQVVEVTADLTRPGVSVSAPAGDPTGVSPVAFVLTFTEPVTGLAVGDLVVAGGTATMTGTGATRQVSVVPAADGPVSVRVPAGVARDAAGNANTAGAAVSRTYDSTAPTPTVTTTATSPTNVAALPVRVTWDEDVVEFTASDVEVVNGTLQAWGRQGRVATFDVIPAGDGDVVVRVPAGVATDAAGNSSAAGGPLRITSDTTAPTVVLSTTGTNPSNADSVPVTATFSEAVSAFTLGDVEVANGSATGLTGSGTTYRFDLAPEAEGAVSVGVLAGAARDEAGNASRASAHVGFVHDTTASADLSYAGPTLVNAPVALTLTLTDDAAITPADFIVANGTVTVTGGPRVHDVVLTPTSDGVAALRLAAGAFTDAAGNVSAESRRVEVTYDGTAPRITRLALPAWPTSAFTAELAFSEPVTGLDPASIAVSNGTAGQVTGSGTDWTFVVTPAVDGPVSVTIDAGAASDASGNPSAPHGPATTTYDTTAPTAVLGSPATSVVTTSPIPVEVVFSEAVSGFDVADLETTNATVTNLSGGGSRFTFDLVPADEGRVTVRVVEGAAQDSAGHRSIASSTLERELDSTRPTLALTTTAAAVTKEATVAVTARFGKAVLGFAQEDVQVVNARIARFEQVDDRTWTLDLRADSDGKVSAAVADGAAASAGGNLAFGGSLEVVVDRVAPDLEVSPPTPTRSGPVVFDVTASESVSGLDEADLSVSGSARPTTLALTAVDDRRWRVSVSGMSADGTVELAVRAGAVQDAAGHESAAVTSSARWRVTSQRLASFRLLQERGVRRANQVVIPVRIDAPEDVRFSARSSNGRLLPDSAIRVTGHGSRRQLSLVGRTRASGRSRVVVTARAGSVTRRIRLTFIAGARGSDRIVGTDAIDVVLAREGTDVLVGRGGADHLYGGYGADRVEGGPGRDVLVGGGGRNALVGGSGADLFVAFPRDRLVDVRRRTGDRVVRPPRRQRSLLAR